MPKPLFQTLSTTSGVFCDLHMAPVPAAILFGQIVRSSQLAGDQRPARSGGTPNPNPNPNHQLAQHTNTSFLAFADLWDSPWLLGLLILMLCLDWTLRRGKGLS